MALAAYATEYAIPQLTPNQLDLTSKVIAALHPIEEIGGHFQSFTCSLGTRLQLTK